MKRLAVIGGTGFGQLANLQDRQVQSADSVFGAVYLEKGELCGTSIFFQPRHGNPAASPPHKVNYRANIDALYQLGVDEIIAVTAVGSVDPALAVGDLVIPDQIIDYTYHRQMTFFDEEIHHIDFTYPYDESLRQELIAAAGKMPAYHCHTNGVYGCTQGPRLETAAEIRRLGNDGCTIVGMTAMPEAYLARERQIAYAGISVIINNGAGINDEVVDVQGIAEVLTKGMSQVASIISAFIAKRT